MSGCATESLRAGSRGPIKQRRSTFGGFPDSEWSRVVVAGSSTTPRPRKVDARRYRGQRAEHRCHCLTGRTCGPGLTRSVTVTNGHPSGAGEQSRRMHEGLRVRLPTGCAQGAVKTRHVTVVKLAPDVLAIESQGWRAVNAGVLGRLIDTNNERGCGARVIALLKCL